MHGGYVEQISIHLICPPLEFDSRAFTMLMGCLAKIHTFEIDSDTEGKVVTRCCI